MSEIVLSKDSKKSELLDNLLQSLDRQYDEALTHDDFMLLLSCLPPDFRNAVRKETQRLLDEESSSDRRIFGTVFGSRKKKLEALTYGMPPEIADPIREAFGLQASVE